VNDGQRIVELMREKEAIYEERNLCIALLATWAHRTGLVVGLANHPEDDPEWDPDWRTIVYLTLPSVGQVSWHIHRSQEPLFHGLPEYPSTWDGHTTEQKYDRVKAFIGLLTPQKTEDIIEKTGM
jgi:hypothetical protein